MRSHTLFDLRAAERFSNSANARPFKLQFRNAKDGQPAELLVYDAIGKDWDGSGISAQDVAGFLADNKGKPVNVKINSPGGLVYDGLTIYNSLLQHTGTVTTIIEGIAASIASIIAMAGDKVKAFESSSMIIHRAQGFCVGNKADMIDCADWLTKIDEQLAAVYAQRTGKSASTMLAFMTGNVDGTVFVAQDALALKLIDEIIRPDKGTRNAMPRTPKDPEAERRRVASAKAAARVRCLEIAAHGAKYK